MSTPQHTPTDSERHAMTPSETEARCAEIAGWKDSSVPMVWRMQDREGRGPWKPGFSNTWLDQDRTDYYAPSVMEDFGLSVLRKAQRFSALGFHCGCACDSLEQMRIWFSENEQRTLYGFGYYIVAFRPTKIIARSKWQVLFAHNTALSRLKPLQAVAQTCRAVIAAHPKP